MRDKASLNSKQSSAPLSSLILLSNAFFMLLASLLKAYHFFFEALTSILITLANHK